MTPPIYEQCWDLHEPTGSFGYPGGLNPKRERGQAQMSVHICDRPRCRASANRAVRKATGHDAVFLSFYDARMDYKARDLAEFYHPNDPWPTVHPDQLTLEDSHG